MDGLNAVFEWSGFMGNPLGNIATAVLLGAYPKNITADISIGYQL